MEMTSVGCRSQVAIRDTSQQAHLNVSLSHGHIIISQNTKQHNRTLYIPEKQTDLKRKNNNITLDSLVILYNFVYLLYVYIYVRYASEE